MPLTQIDYDILFYSILGQVVALIYLLLTSSQYYSIQLVKIYSSANLASIKG